MDAYVFVSENRISLSV